MSSNVIASDKTKMHITDIIDIDELKALFESYSDITGMVTALLDLEGNVLIATNWQDSCTQFHRVNGATSKRCHESDTALAGALEKGEKYTAYRCRNGLVDVATPVIIDGMHLANFFTGQFFYQKPDLAYFANQADQVGFDKEAYLAAIQKVPVYDQQTIQEHMAFLVRIAEMVGKMGAVNLKVRAANKELESHKQNLQALVEERTSQLNTSLEEAKAANLAKTTFLTNMSHELRTPLHAVLGFSEILEGKEIDPQKKRYLKSINVAGSGLLSLINSILDLSKIESGKMPVQCKPMSLRSLLVEVRTIFDRQAEEKDLALNINVDNDMPDVIFFDDAKLRQILINLVGNAIKFTEQGEIEIRVGFNNTSEKYELSTLFVSVKDTGIGISDENQMRIFDVFEQAKGQNISDYGGTGLGLALTRQLTELMNGKLTLESTVGKGSIFVCQFPKVEVLPDSSLSKETENDGKLNKTVFADAVILVVDDNPMNRDLMATYLNEWNFHVILAENGMQAIEQAKLHLPNIIFMDMKMPVMNGYDATMQIKSDERTRHIPIVAATASALAEDEIRIRKITDDYLRKPIKKKDLIKSLKLFIPETSKTSSLSETNRILVVDDNEMNCVLLSDILEDYENIEVSVAYSGDEAVAAACSDQRPDVIFMDYQMPGINGLEATQKIRLWESNHKKKASRIYALTAMNDEEMRKMDSDNLFDGILGKPFDSEDIDRLIGRQI